MDQRIATFALLIPASIWALVLICQRQLQVEAFSTVTPLFGVSFRLNANLKPNANGKSRGLVTNRNGNGNGRKLAIMSSTYDRTIQISTNGKAKNRADVENPQSTTILDVDDFKAPTNRGLPPSLYPLLRPSRDKDDLFVYSEQLESELLLFEGIKDIADIELVPKRNRNAIVGSISDRNDICGAFLSFHFNRQSAQHDITLGRLAQKARLLTFSRIKRWWMAPNFCSNIDDIPVETQLLLIEITHDHKMVAPSTSAKTYAVIAPLIDYSSGFRVTLFGADGGKPAIRGKGILAARAESGDEYVETSSIKNALYVATGSNPYALLDTAFDQIAQKLGTFRLRKHKRAPRNLDYFGFCTWDAFYSSVDSQKVTFAVQSLRDAGVPPRFVIIDDGWQSTALAKNHSLTLQLPPASSAIPATSEAAIAAAVVNNASDIESPPSVVDAIPLTTIEDIIADGELSGAQIDGQLAAERITDASNPLIRLATQFASSFYIQHVEQADSDALSVKTWAKLSQTVLKDKLVDFFDKQTDFSKRLTSWKANAKFEDISRGTTLKSFVGSLKEDMGVDFVFFWHALSGYWGGVSENENDDMTKALVAHDYAAINGSNVPASTYRSHDASFVSTSNLPIWPPQSASTTTLQPLEGAKVTSEESRLTPLAVQRSYSKPSPHLLKVEPALSWDPAALAGVGSVAIEKLDTMYRKMHEYLADAGADGVKVDAQSGIGVFGTGRGGGSAFARASVQAMERSVKKAFEGRKDFELSSDQNVYGSHFLSRVWQRIHRVYSGINIRSRLSGGDRISGKFNGSSIESHGVAITGCMCHSTENLYNYLETPMIRASDDFYPKDIPAQVVHIVSCAYNSVMLGEIAFTDWDMFHSVHPFAEMHAAARAISGGPVYVSDTPGNHCPELLRRLVLPDGSILRTTQPARPTVDCLFQDVMRDGKSALKVWSTNKVSHVVGVFNTQGSFWDRKSRKYVSKVSGGDVPCVTAKVSPLDANMGFPAGYANDPTQSTGSSPADDGSSSIRGNGPEFVANEYIAWSATRMERDITLLASANVHVAFDLEYKGWDVVSFSHVYKFFDRARSWAQWFQRRQSDLVLWRSSLESIRIDGLPSLGQPNRDTEALGESATPQEATKLIAFAPIGLMDMLNCGGAIEDVNIYQRSYTAVITMRGVGRFAVVTNKAPQAVFLNGNKIDYIFKLVDVRLNKDIIAGETSGLGNDIGKTESILDGSGDQQASSQQGFLLSNAVSLGLLIITVPSEMDTVGKANSLQLKQISIKW